jgi:putative membrane protein
MKKNSLIFILGLLPLVPCSSHFGYGLLLTAELWLLFFAYLLSQQICELIYIKSEIGKRMFTCLFVMACTTVFSLTASLIFPVAELALRFYIYVTAVSYILILCVAEYDEDYQSFSLIVFYTVFFLLFSLLREIMYFGSVSFLIPSGLFSLTIIPEAFLAFRFFGTNAGAFFLLAVSLWIYFSVRKARAISFTDFNN